MKRYCLIVITRHGTEFFVGPVTFTSRPTHENSWEVREMAEFKLAALEQAYTTERASGRYRMDVYEFLT